MSLIPNRNAAPRKDSGAAPGQRLFLTAFDAVAARAVVHRAGPLDGRVSAIAQIAYRTGIPLGRSASGALGGARPVARTRARTVAVALHAFLGPGAGATRGLLAACDERWRTAVGASIAEEVPGWIAVAVHRRLDTAELAGRSGRARRAFGTQASLKGSPRPAFVVRRAAACGVARDQAHRQAPRPARPSHGREWCNSRASRRSGFEAILAQLGTAERALRIELERTRSCDSWSKQAP